MKKTSRTYIAIDLKSFYASVECVERGLDPLTANLVVADIGRTEKTICLAVSPSLKAYGIPGRARLFEVVQRLREVNAARRRQAPGCAFAGQAYSSLELEGHPELEIGYITAPPRMALYMEYSTRIYQIYLKYAAPEDIHVYSIDEVFIDATNYLNAYHTTAGGLAKIIIDDVLQNTGITATAGIGTNLYLCKIAMDIEAKHVAPDENGVRIAELDEMSYRHKLWSHRPLTDFWRVGRGYANKLEGVGLYTMGDIARCSLGGANDYHNEALLYKLFGVNAQLLIDHAWGWEPCTIADIKAYKPADSSIGSGQVLKCPYTFEKAKLAVREMADLLALDLVDRELATDQMELTVGYDIENLADPDIKTRYKGAVTTDRYGRKTPKHAHSTINLDFPTSSAKLISEAVVRLFDRIVDRELLVRRLTIAANHVIDERDAVCRRDFEQLDLFTDYEAAKRENNDEETALEREKRIQKTILDIRKKYGKNAVIKGMNLREGATTVERNKQIGGHKA